MADIPGVNGNRFSWVSIECSIDGVTFTNLMEINYSTTIERADVYGTGPQKVGRTRGRANHEASLTFHKEAARNFQQQLGAGWADKTFNVTVNYADDGNEIVSDSLEGCKVGGFEDSHSDGTEALTVTVPLSVFDIKYNGLSAFAS